MKRARRRSRPRRPPRSADSPAPRPSEARRWRCRRDADGMLYLALLPVLIWLYLALARGGFWRVGPLLATDAAPLDVAARVVAVVPARDEAPVIGFAVQSLLNQHFAGALHIIVVDDASSDGTAE